MINNDIDIKLTDVPNKKYEKFFEKFKEITNLETSSWNVTHLLGYFCKKYKEQYNTDYKFKFNSQSPSKCFEVFQIKKLAMHLTSKPVLLKEYIDWVFINKVTKAKKKFTSISFITNEEIIKEYKFNVLLSDKKNSNFDRSTILPDEYKLIFSNINMPINTYGDLAFMSQMPDMSNEVINAFIILEQIGFDKNILTKIL